MDKRSTAAQPDDLSTLPVITAEEGAPLPAALLQLSFITLSAGSILHRVHLSHYAANQFNPGVKGNARFSPIKTRHGQPIPTLYGGSTRDCALMETVFHDVPFAPGLKTLDKNKLHHQLHSCLKVNEDMLLIDLSSIALRKLGITRKQLIDTEKHHYPLTRRWAAALHHQSESAQGLSWISRQDDSARAVMLFGDRISPGMLTPLNKSLSLIDDSDTYGEVLHLASRLGVFIIAAK